MMVIVRKLVAAGAGRRETVAIITFWLKLDEADQREVERWFASATVLQVWQDLEHYRRVTAA